jgi:holin-like protein
MIIMIQIMVLFILSLLGTWLSSLIPIPIPASVIAMILLFAALSLGLLRKHYVADAAQFMLRHITLFFIPFGVVGIMQNAEQILSFWPVFLLICLISTLVTFVATAYTVAGVIRWQERRRAHASHD